MDQTQSPESEIDRLTRENEKLRVELEVAKSTAATAPLPGVAGPAAAPPPRSRQRWRAFVAVLLITVGVLLAPVAVVAHWTENVVADTDAFVATVSPLVDDPAFQAYLVDQIVSVVDEKVDVQAVTKDLFDGLSSLNLPPRAQDALTLLEAPAVRGVESLICSAAERVVRSDAFAQVWDQALRLSQTQIIAALQGDTSSALVISDTGEVGIQLGPIIAEVKKQLVAQGFGLASNIPEIDRIIPIAQSDALVQARTAYQLLNVLGSALPWVSLLLIAAGVIVARRRARTLIWAGLALGVSMALLAAGISVGRILFVNAVSPGNLPAGLAGTVYDTLVPLVYATALSVGLAAVTVAVVAYLAGPFRGATAVRRLTTDGARSLRGAAAKSGVTTGRVGTWLYRARRYIRDAVGVGAAMVAIFWRPLTPAVIIWTAVLALLVVLLLELLQRPPDEAPPRVDSAPTEPTDRAETAELSAEEALVGAAPAAAGTAGTGTAAEQAVGSDSGTVPPSRDDID
ncbi:MAG: hypothetical protein H7311_00735 [Ramlibacter sp.]|nr:hypothetical protein [Cryobacterium sp.]